MQRPLPDDEILTVARGPLARKTKLQHEIRHNRPYADPEKAARRILEIANAVESIQSRVHIEKINAPFLYRDRAPPAAEYGAGLKLAIERGWLDLHESGTYAAFTQAGAELLA